MSASNVVDDRPTAADMPPARDVAPQVASIDLIQPVDLYSQVNRATKYGFLFIGFTFLALLMFDVIGGVRVSRGRISADGRGDRPVLRARCWPSPR